MSELRWHPLLRQWVTVAPWRQDRTYHPPAGLCPLCPTKPGAPETEIPEPDYHIAVFENRFPAYTGDQGGAAGEAGGPLWGRGPAGGRMPPYPRGGRCEVVCYTSDHDSSLGEQPVEHIRDLVEVWQDRFAELSTIPGVRYVYIFENRGESIGVTLSHPHGQIYAYPFVPPRIETELASFQAHRRKTGRCLYCDVLASETGERTVVEAGTWIGFVPAFARFPYEVHLAPRRHLSALTDLDEREAEDLARALKGLLVRYDALFGFPLPYVMAMHARPCGRGHRGFHFHIEFYPPNRSADKLKYLAGSELGAGAFILDARAEESAALLRRAAEPPV